MKALCACGRCDGCRLRANIRARMRPTPIDLEGSIAGDELELARRVLGASLTVKDVRLEVRHG